MGWELIESKSSTLEKGKALEFAAKHAGLQHSPVERELDPSRVKKLVAIIRDRRALPFNWATVQYDGKVLRMNGQHSSNAILEIGMELPDRVAFHMDEYQADDREGMVELFRQFDQRWQSRTTQDISGAFQGLVTELADCNRKAMKVAAEGLSWCKRSVLNEPAPSGDDVYDLFHHPVYTPFFLWANGISKNGRRELLRKEIMAAMWQTYEVSQFGAEKFWKAASFGVEYFSDDMEPGAVLIGELNRAMEDKDFREKEFMSPASYYKKAIKAWNAFCSGQRISSLKVAKAKKGQPAWPEVHQYASLEDAA